MKFQCYNWKEIRRTKERIRELKYKYMWNQIFAWHPIRVRTNECIWLEFVWVKYHCPNGVYRWEYRSRLDYRKNIWPDLIENERGNRSLLDRYKNELRDLQARKLIDV